MRWTVVLLLTASLAGCAGTDEGLPDSVARMQEQVEPALPGDVGLLAVVGTESRTFAPGDDSDRCGSFDDDEEHGDGVAPAWSYVFTNGTHAATVVTDADGFVRCLLGATPDGLEEPAGAGIAGRLEAWRTTARQAADAIAAADPDYAAVVAQCPATMSLAQSEDGPRWTFRAVDPATEQARSWVVDAVDGTVVPDASGLEQAAACLFRPENGTAQGQMSGTRLQGSSTPAVFTLDHSHAQLTLAIESEDPAAQLGRDYEVRIVLPDGTEFRRTGGVNDPNPQSTLFGPPRGEYRVYAYPASVGTHTFSVEYSASG